MVHFASFMFLFAAKHESEQSEQCAEENVDQMMIVEKYQEPQDVHSSLWQGYMVRYVWQAYLAQIQYEQYLEEQ